MSFSRRRTAVDVEDTLERLRLLSAECSSAGVEEEDASEVVQTTASTAAKKDYCAECHLSFGLAEKRVPVHGGVVHTDCHEKIQHRDRQRMARFDRFLTREVH